MLKLWPAKVLTSPRLSHGHVGAVILVTPKNNPPTLRSLSQLLKEQGWTGNSFERGQGGEAPLTVWILVRRTFHMAL